MTTEVNEHFNASTREFHQNTSVDTLQYAISFPSIVEEMLLRVCKQSFVFFTSPSSYYEVLDKFISFDTLPKIPYLPFKHLFIEDLELRLLTHVGLFRQNCLILSKVVLYMERSKNHEKKYIITVQKKIHLPKEV